MTGLGAAQQKKTEKPAGAENPTATYEQKTEPQNKAEHIRDLKRAERFEKLISLTPDTFRRKVEDFGKPANFADFRFPGFECGIERTDKGYTFQANQIIKRKDGGISVKFSTYYFNNEGKFLEKHTTLPSGEQLPVDKSSKAEQQADRMLSKLGAHNEVSRRDEEQFIRARKEVLNRKK